MNYSPRSTPTKKIIAPNSPLPGKPTGQWPEMQQAIALLNKNPEEFLKQFMKLDPDQTSKGVWSITSR